MEEEKDFYTLTGIKVGDVLVGKYRVERLLGVGGMGVVAAATHVQLDDPVAIKFLLPEALQNREAVARFAQEARAAVKIKSEHVARVSDVGELENGAPYMVMEYLHGTDLAGVLAEQGSLSIEVAIEHVLQASEAIAEAHAARIVHRDLKPSNLFLVARADGSPSIKVLDFGISKLLPFEATDLNITEAAKAMGSPNYMSPEQMASARDVDARTDIWSLGVILHELLAGSTPFTGEALPQLCASVLQQPAPPLREIRPEIPAALEQVVLRCLEKDRELRYANVAELAAALSPFARPEARVSVERIRRVLRASNAPGAETRTSSALPSLAAPRTPGSITPAELSYFTQARRAPRKAALSVLGGLLALVAVAWLAGFGAVRLAGLGKSDAAVVEGAAAIARASAEAMRVAGLDATRLLVPSSGLALEAPALALEAPAPSAKRTSKDRPRSSSAPDVARPPAPAVAAPPKPRAKTPEELLLDRK